jgi:hypothetical protein
MIGFTRVTKTAWYAAGGFANPNCTRRELAGAWSYWIRA